MNGESCVAPKTVKCAEVLSGFSQPFCDVSQGSPLLTPDELTKALRRSASAWQATDDVRLRSWGALRARLQQQLEDMLVSKSRQAIQAWQSKVQSYPAAVRWVKAAPPAAWLLKTPQGVVAGRTDGVQAVRQAWQPVFCGTTSPVFMRTSSNMHVTLFLGTASLIPA